MKVRDRLKQKIRKDLFLAFLFIACAVISLNWFESMPNIFVFLVGGMILFLVEALLFWIKLRKVDPLTEEIVARPVIISEIDNGGITLKGESRVLWNEMLEIRKVSNERVSLLKFYSPDVLLQSRLSIYHHRRFFYSVQWRNGEWLQLSNVGLVTYKGSFKNGAMKSPESVNLLKQLLTEAGKQPHIRLVCHNEAVGRFEALDLRKELEDLSKWEKK